MAVISSSLAVRGGPSEASHIHRATSRFQRAGRGRIAVQLLSPLSDHTSTSQKTARQAGRQVVVLGMAGHG